MNDDKKGTTSINEDPDDLPQNSRPLDYIGQSMNSCGTGGSMKFQTQELEFDETTNNDVAPADITGMKVNKAKAIASVIGGFIYMLRLGSEYMSSSIAPYIASYYDVDIKQAQIILPSLFVVNMFLSPLGAQLAQRVHPKLLILVTGAFGLSTVFLSTLMTDFWSFTGLYVLGFGVTNALTYMVPVHHGWLWFPGRPGLVSGLIICGFGFGALIFNNVSRMIVNPENESSDADGKFSDTVNQRVPEMLQSIVLCFALMTLLAIVLISPGPEPTCEEGTSDQPIADETLVDEYISSQFEQPVTLSSANPNLSLDSIDQSQNVTTAMSIQKKKQLKRALRLRIQRVKLSHALRSHQFWLVYAMACFSILFGYYTIDVFKMFGQNYADLNSDEYLTWVGSLASVFTSLRFLWSAALDSQSYKLIYGILLLTQIALSLTMFVAVTNRTTYIIWICGALFCEGGHFTLVPNILKKIFGDQATSLYGITLTYTGLTSLVMIGLLETSLSKDYLLFYVVTAGSSCIALALLLLAFNEDKFIYDRSKLKEALKNDDNFSSTSSSTGKAVENQ